MQKSAIFSVLLFLLLSTLSAQEKPAYQIFNSKSKTIDYGKMLKDIQEADIVFFGELHDNPICHWLQLELTKDLFAAKDSQLTMGAEFFERDDQLLLDELTSGKIQDKHFEKEAKLWPNYETDYKPLLQFATDHQLKFVASNVPRRYANILYKDGMEALQNLSPEAQKLMVPLPFQVNMELSSYKKMLSMGHGHGGEQMVQAQALKDATMAYFILKNLKKEQLFIHYNGSYHSNNKEGIIWYIQQENPDLKIVNIASVQQEALSELSEENQELADYTICISASMTKTH